MALAAGPKARNLPAPDLSGLSDDPAERAREFLARAGINVYAWQDPVLCDLVAPKRPRVAYVQCPRKNGKTRLAAMVALCELILREDRHIYAVSDSERNLHSVLWLEICHLIESSPALQGRLHIFQSKIENQHNGSFLELRPGNFKASQGINPHLVLADEVHLIPESVWHGYQMAGASREDPLLLGTTTPGYQLSGTAYDLYEEAKAGTDADLYSCLWEPDDPQCELDDLEAWEQANPVLHEDDDRARSFLAGLRYDLTHLPPNEFARFRLGKWTAVAEAWLPHGAWQNCSAPRALEPKERVWLGFDGSWSGDSTGLVACTSDGHLAVVGYWHKPAMVGEWRVPISDVEDRIRAVCRDYDVQEVVCDPARWQRSLQALAADGLPMVEFPQSPSRMIPATAKFYDAVLDRRLSYSTAEGFHGKALAAHISNARVKESAAGIMVRKADKDSPAKIDLAVCSIMAHDRATRSKGRRAPISVDWF